jgi:hypothetical protein
LIGRSSAIERERGGQRPMTVARLVIAIGTKRGADRGEDRVQRRRSLVELHHAAHGSCARPAGCARPTLANPTNPATTSTRIALWQSTLRAAPEKASRRGGPARSGSFPCSTGRFAHPDRLARCRSWCPE